MKKLIPILIVLVILAGLVSGCADYKKYVTLGQYKGIETDAINIEVTDGEVQDAIDRTLTAAATQIEITDRPVKDGDSVTIDYEGAIAETGEPFEGGTNTDFSVTIGSNSMIKGFEDGLIGVHLNETVELNLTFPEDYENDTSLQGVDVIFTVTVKKILENVLPEYTDEWVQSISESETIEEYEKSIYDTLYAAEEDLALSNRKTDVWEKVMANCTVSGYPKSKLKKSEKNITDYYESLAESYDLTFADFLAQAYGVTETDFALTVTSWAKSEVGSNMVANAIAKVEGITISDEEYEAGKLIYIQGSGYEDEAAYKEAVGKSFEQAYGKETIYENLLFEKVLAFCISQSISVSAEESAD